MRIVTYNVNGLRARVSSHGSLLNFLNSLEADIICLQETKLSRQEISTDVALAEGYEAFFSCTRSKRGRMAYSGVATFCRVKTAFSSTEVALPLTASEGVTGLLECSKVGGTKATVSEVGDCEVQRLDCLSRQELLKLDNEGRCIITDHGHFVLFNIYGPCVQCGDSERFEFKLNFFKVLQRRWKSLLDQGRRVFIVGDLNIAPFPIDSCDPGPDFEDNLCRKWLRSLLKEGGGPFIDVFRAIHPKRKEAYTCWSQVTGAEEFNFGTRIDLILVAGLCLHQDTVLELHGFVTCHIQECDILTQFKRCKPDNVPKWKGGRSLKLEGSDHAPVYIKLREVPDISLHNVPALAARYMPEISGRQQSIVSLLHKRPYATESEGPIISELSSENDYVINNNEGQVKSNENGIDQVVKTPAISVSTINSCGSSLSLNRGSCTELLEGRQGSEVSRKHLVSVSQEIFAKNEWFGSNKIVRKEVPLTQNGQRVQKTRKKKNNAGQCSLRSFFKVNLSKTSSGEHDRAEIKDHTNQRHEPMVKSDASPDTTENNFTSETAQDESTEINLLTGQNGIECFQCNSNCNLQGKVDISTSYSACEEVQPAQPMDSVISVEKKNVKIAALEWRKILDFMASSVPLCKGHGEPCVARAVKKAGPNIGRGFYVCARAKGPASNPEARCDHFEWASSRFRGRGI